MLPLLFVFLVLALVGAGVGWMRATSATQKVGQLEAEQARLLPQSTQLSQENAQLKSRLGSVVSLDEEKAHVQAQIETLKAAGQKAQSAIQAGKARGESELAQLNAQLAARKGELDALEERANLQSFGFYEPRYEFASSAAYGARLEEIRGEQKQMVKDKAAATCSIKWQVNGSEKEGQKQIAQTLKLMLRAFNGECDAAVARVSYSNITTMETRIQKAYEAINALAQVQQCRLAPYFLDLKMQELRLAHEYQEKVQAEKEEQRRIREEMREEETARRELERAQADAEKEEARAAQALQKARAEVASLVGEKQRRMQEQIAELERRLTEAQSNKARAIAQSQLTKSGHVYVISNIGSFGENVFKIGMTRRLEPLDRVRELGDASVPFLFDVHAIIWSQDAPALEAKLHRAFAHLRVNRVNERREFFHVSLLEIAQVVKANHGEIEFVHEAQAKEYRQTVAMRQAQAPPLNGASM